MGTPEFAVASLDALLKAGANIVAVVTGPDKPAGRGMKLSQSAVKKFASENNLLVLQPEKLRNPEFISQLQNLKADLQVVVAFRMLPEMVWDMPPLGTINLHGSLLPQYRGAAPINWAVINGDKETGVTTFRLQHEIDTGEMLVRATMPITEEDTAGSVHDKMMELGAKTLVETIEKLAEGNIQSLPQDESAELRKAPKLFTEDTKINWNDTIDNIYNRIRGLSPYPGAFTIVNDKIFKIYKSKKIYEQPDIAIGSYKTDNKKEILFAAKDGYIAATEIQPEGKKKMPTEDYLRGHQL
ncbi:MAG: methionyl-tRNA formyltransferase [Pseudopedobacter saltans]|uniref:Methionyl-tRNA formyltransferase n=1 Tax=Pseudopedobacter saltans TaxID=151895 RepID=A0A2W5H8I8_9SPHI|nr:MAG: methionyl-tRNA formyltransferase [Pseudopedobacter saltans]